MAYRFESSVTSSAYHYTFVVLWLAQSNALDIRLGMNTTVTMILTVTTTMLRCVLNVCFAYSSEQELSKASDCIANALHSSELLPWYVTTARIEHVLSHLIHLSDVTEELVDNTIYSAGSAPVDLLIRTSGEKRLSDFMLWQVRKPEAATRHIIIIIIMATV